MATIEGLKLFQPKLYPDDRGFFFESFKQNDKLPIFTQDNCAYSKKNVLRGLHQQRTPCGQSKLIWVSYGEIFDVAVDVRQNSPTYLHYQAVILSSKNLMQFYIPEGFLHGYLVLSDEAIVHYKVSRSYAPEYEQAVRYDDPSIGIEWPCKAPILSKKDAAAPNVESLRC